MSPCTCGLGGYGARLLVVSIALLFHPAHAGDTGCGPMPTEALIEGELAKSYEAFDQTPGQGWRQWVEGGCYTHERLLLERYLERRSDLSARERTNIRFHLGQVLAYLGETEAALNAFRQCFTPAALTGEFNWNAYLRGTIAFLERDRPALLRAEAELAAGKEQFGNRINLRVLRSFVKHPDAAYSVAYEAAADETD